MENPLFVKKKLDIKDFLGKDVIAELEEELLTKISVKSFKTEVHLTKEQKSLFFQYEGTCRFIYNKFLHMSILYVKLRKKHREKVENMNLPEKEKNKLLNSKFKEPYLGRNIFRTYLNHYVKNKLTWISITPSKTIEKALMNLERAFSNISKMGSGFPSFKSKKHNKKSITFMTSNNDNFFNYKNRRYKLPKIGFIKVLNKKYVYDDFSQCTLSYKHGRFYGSFLNIRKTFKTKLSEKRLGLDMGISVFAYGSNNEKYHLIDTKDLDKKIKKANRDLNRKVLNSKNFFKQKDKLGNLYRRKYNLQEQSLNEIVNKIEKEGFGMIIIENLNIKGMKKNKKLSNAIQNGCWGRFFKKISDKFFVKKIDRFFASTKTCSCCGSVKKEMKLSERIYKCDNCSLILDRDYNASLNILNYQF